MARRDPQPHPSRHDPKQTRFIVTWAVVLGLAVLTALAFAVFVVPHAHLRLTPS